MNAIRATSSRRSPGVRRRVPAGRPTSAGAIRSRRLRRKRANSCRSTPQLCVGGRAQPGIGDPWLRPERRTQAGRMTSLLNDKVVFVSGAGRGIGAAAARLFAREGARVLLAARTEAQLKAVNDEIRTAGGTADHVRCDLADPDSVQAAIDRAVALFGRLD